ncbi:MAG TPA: SPOR domain-containing protein [Gemmatimonadaceae bacterium]|nr:SPOR domain-containing protein [Gemmatimonadaceae bacterium]
MRRLLAFAIATILILACRGDEQSNPPPPRNASVSPARGPDALVLRVKRSGGVPTVVAYPRIDSTVWTATDAAPAIERVLAFDQDAGLIAAVDSRQLPFWIDLNVGAVTIGSRKPLRGLISVDGSTIYGVGADGAVARFTPSGNWTFKPRLPARAVFPQTNGTVLILGGRGASTRVWRIHPPETRITDSVLIPEVLSGVGAPLGDRIYFTTADHALIGLRARTLALGRRIEFDHPIRAVATTPSGDRFYVLTDSSTTLYVIDSFQDRIEARPELPGQARDLRVDAFGRYVLVRPAKGDSVWVLAIGTNQIVRTVASEWRGDAPFVSIDGAIAGVVNQNLVITGGSSATTRTLAGGASEFWYPFTWNGLRPRAAALDQPVKLPGDSDTTHVGSPTAETTTVVHAAPPPARLDSTKLGFSVSFAALLDETRAREAAAKITINGQTARVVAGMAGGTAVYNVILGPYPTRDEAERIGKASGQSYVVVVGTP